MEKLPMCRICLVENVRMYIVANRNLHELYEKLTNIPFVTEDSRPILACFVCCTKLKQCSRFLQKCLEAEEQFAQMMNGDYEPNPSLNQDHLELYSGFIKTSIEQISIVDECQTESIAIKKELPAVCEGLDEIVETKEEHQSDEHEPGNLDNSCLDVADTPPHCSESDLEDDVPVMHFKTEVEEEVTRKKQRARETIKRVEALDMSEDEAAELLQSDPWHVKRWMRDLPGASELPRASDTPGASDTPSSNTVFLAPLAPSARSEVIVAAEVDVRPSTSTVTALSQTVPRRDGSELDSDFDDEFDVPVMPVVGRDLPDTEELDEPLKDLVNEIDTGMDDAADSLLGTSAIFTWSLDFDSFRGVRGEFSGPTPGPIKDYETPYDAFTDIWDEDIIRLIATETNRYAHQTIETMRNAGTLKPSSRLHSWTDTNADEIMVFFAMLMYMAIDPRTSITEYWTSDEVLHLPGFKSLMSFNRYTLLNKCLHFVDNVAVQSQQLSQSGVSSSTGVSRRLGKLAPIIEHLGKKFKALYNLGPDISIDESLTLFKGRLSWAQTIRSKAARFGIDSYELCESRTGYMARFQIYTGKDDSSDGDLSLGVDLGGKSTKVVLELLQGLEHRGHCVVMDNYYNCPSLARYLKSLGFDCLGTLRVNRRNVPSDFKVSKKVKKGTIISRHSGDVSIIAWMDSKMVNIISTYHRPDTYNGTRAGKPTEKPVCIKDYNKSMGGVDLKDQKLSMYLLERKRGVKWYVKMFKRLLNVSIHNALVMYQSSLKRTTDKLPVTHREFRYALAESLLKRHRPCSIGISQVPVENVRLRRNIMHEPEHLMGRENTKRCVICQRQKKSKAVHSRCITCDAYLCFGDCWRIWHSAKELPGLDIRGRKRKRKE